MKAKYETLHCGFEMDPVQRVLSHITFYFLKVLDGILRPEADTARCGYRPHL